MKRFRKILVGVDLSWSDRFVSEELSASNAEAVRQALGLAQLTSATVDFLFSLDLSAKDPPCRTGQPDNLRLFVGDGVKRVCCNGSS